MRLLLSSVIISHVKADCVISRANVQKNKKKDMLLKYVLLSEFDGSRIIICIILTVNIVLHQTLREGNVC